MPLSASSPAVLHLLQNVSLLALSIVLAPLCTFIVICSYIASTFSNGTKTFQGSQKQRATFLSTRPSRIILVTGVGMSKGLSIARAFHRKGHIVIGADFEPHGIPVCGRFSTALKKFYRLPRPRPSSDKTGVYVDELIRIIKHERVELWVSCSGVASAIEDAEAAGAVEKQTSCKAVQFGAELTKILHEKFSFIEQARQFGLNVPETHLVTSIDDAMNHLYPLKPRFTGSQMIMKSVGLDDSIRADMTLLPRPSFEGTRSHITRLNPSASRPFVLQQFICGPEYCTHSVVVRGHVAAFVACPSAELLMHYKALSPTSALSEAMQKYTQIYADQLGTVTGHFSIDFMLDKSDLGSELMTRLYPIECNPRAHTAVVLLDNESMVDAYLSVFEDDRANMVNHWAIVTSPTSTGYYWVGHDIVTKSILPLLSMLTLKADISSTMTVWREFLEHVVHWKDGTYEVWDPWPFWCLYCIYWPGMFLSAVLTRSWWSRCNVSTTKMFRC